MFTVKEEDNETEEIKTEIYLSSDDSGGESSEESVS
jgi:hypothetical protein